MSSRHRLTLNARTPLETTSTLDELEDAYRHHDLAAAHTVAT